MNAKNDQQVNFGQGEQTRPYIYELDLMRPVTAVTVVAVHVLSGTTMLNHTQAGLQVQNGIFTSVSVTRDVFMFITALALAYVYYGRPFELSRFWAKRSIGVLVPYFIWSIAYTWVNNPSQHSPGAFARLALFNILTGNASYQLYYILLAIQFYLVLPLFLLFLKHVQKHPWRALLISFALQVLLMYFDYRYLQQGSLASRGVWQIVAAYQNSFLLTYQFYFILGGLAALYLKQARAFVLRHGKWIVGGFVLALAAVWVHFLLQVDVYHESFGYATSVLQPMMTLYSPTVIVLLCWLACRWAIQTNQLGTNPTLSPRQRPRRSVAAEPRHFASDASASSARHSGGMQGEGHPKGYRFWHTLSNASFGIYLVHVFILTALLQRVVPLMPEAWPVALRIFLTWFLTAGGAVGISILLMKTPVLSHLVGRSAHWHSSWDANALHEWFSNPFHHPRKVEQKGTGDAQHV
ncbi:MAG: acyltransferase [Chloroflexi bacterium]|nr:MAG: acyltransferase [Chloroflexota bacterium]